MTCQPSRRIIRRFLILGPVLTPEMLLCGSQAVPMSRAWLDSGFMLAHLIDGISSASTSRPAHLAASPQTKAGGLASHAPLLHRTQVPHNPPSAMSCVTPPLFRDQTSNPHELSVTNCAFSNTALSSLSFSPFHLVTF